MSRPASKVRHDDVTRLIKPLLKLGLPISRVIWDGDQIHVIIGESGELHKSMVDITSEDTRPKEVETL